MKAILLLFIIISSTVAVGQRRPRNPIPCDEMGCDVTDSTYQTHISCLNCLLDMSDSTMRAEVNGILQKCKNQKKGCNSFIKEQELWELKCEKKASNESNKYKGGTMEITEYVRTQLLESRKRITYLRDYSKTLDK